MKQLPGLLLFLTLFFIPVIGHTMPAPEEQQLRIGVLSFRTKDQITAQFTPLAKYLEKELGRKTTIAAYGFAELDAAVANNHVDIVLTNPGHYIQLQYRYQLSSPMASLIIQSGNHQLASFGGVIFTSAKHTNISNLKDIHDRKTAIVSTSSFGGCQTQFYELLGAGMNLPEKESLIITGMPHDGVVKAVLSGQAEVGFVRSGVLEAMEQEGTLDIGAIKIINQQHHPYFPYRVSTRLYPEWVVSAHRNIDSDLTRKIAMALLSVSPGTLQGIHGFSIPADYSGVVDLLRRLRLPPFDKTPEITLSDLMNKYAGWITALGIMAGLLISTSLSLIIQNRKVRQSQTSLLESHVRLSEQEEKFRTVANYTLDWEYWESPDHEFLYMSPSAKQITGYPCESFIADPSLLFRIIHPDDLALFYDHHNQFCCPEDGLIEYRIINKDGSIRWLEHICHQVNDNDGSFRGRRVSNRDVTDRKKAEEALRESNLLNQQIIACAHEGIVVYDRDLRYRLWNPFMEELSGLRQEHVIGKKAWELFPVLKENGVLGQLELALNGQIPGALTLPYTINGKSGWVVDTSAPLINENSEIIGVMATVQDITARKNAEDERIKLEKQLLHSQKLESLGVLAGGIAHDFNNILTAIIGNTELALMRLTPDSPAAENLRRVKLSAARAADLAKQMLAYSGKGSFVVENINLSRLVEDMGQMLEVSISKKTVLRYNLSNPLPTVKADATQISQIVMNLVINASEAIGDQNGFITITTGYMNCDRNYLKDVWLEVDICEGLYAYLEIADTGCGMDKETLTRIFDPFFTTKFTGRGLGMAAVLGIVRGHQGAIKVHSEPGNGSTIRVLLPAMDNSVELLNIRSDCAEWRGSGTVLLVDDEESVRAIGNEMLRELGFEVITATDGRDALTKFSSRDDIHLVFLDLTMPNMDGEECFRELRQLNPDVKVIMCSGLSEHEVTHKFTGKGLAGFVQKPYKLTELRESLKKLV